MNEKQRRLIDFFSRLAEPTPPPAPIILESAEEIPAPAAPSAPPKLTPDSVRAMLEQQRDARAAGGTDEGPAAPAPPLPVERPITDRTIEVAVSAAEKALNDEAISAEEQEVLEAIVLPGKRPVLDIANGDMSPPPAGWEFLADYRPTIKEVLPSIGRINVPELTNVPYAGTAFFVGEGLLLTNRHVASLFVQGVGAGPKYLRFQPERTARMDPRYEVGDPDAPAGGDRFEVVESLLVHPYWDAALLRVRPLGGAQLPPALKLARRRPPSFGGGATPLVAVIGYPALDSRNNIEQQMNIFRKIFNRKRLMPGYLVGFGDVETSWKAKLTAATHDASTLGGNSGSAVVDVESGLVLALHFGGRYLVANYGVPAWELAQDRRVVDLGVQFADYPGQAADDEAGGPAGFAPAEASSTWLKTWDSVAPLQPEAVPAGVPAAADGAGGPAGAEQPAIPAAPDWFERISDAELVEAMRRDAARTERLIRATLLPQEADDLIADLRQSLAPVGAESVEEGVFDFLLGGGKVDPALPEIVFLHGIMGSHLAAYGGLGGRVWLSPLAFAAGGVATRLALADDGEHDRVANQILYPDGHVRLVYEKAARKWRMRGFVVHEFAFDWRKPIANAAERLHLFIESLRLERPSKKFALVGHSMGGLVAALYAVRHPEWSTRVTQAIMLGSPLRGSFVPIEGLLGSYSLFPKVALADTRDEVKDYVAMARTLPGLLDMLPDPEIFPDAAPLYQRATWPADRAPAQIWLDQSRQLKRVLAASPILETARLIVSPGHPTVSGMTIVGGQLRTGRQNMPGDGTVPTRSAAASVPGVAVYRASLAHADLPREDRVIDAVESLLKDGRCDLPPLSQRERDDLTPIEAAEAIEAIEAAAAADLPERMRSGIFTQRDVDYLLRNGGA